MLVTAVERKYLQRIIFNFHKKNPAEATQDDPNDDDDADDALDIDDDALDDDVVNNVVAVPVTLGRFCVSVNFQQNSHATFLLLLWFWQRKMAAELCKNCAKVCNETYIIKHTIYENIFIFFL